MLVSTKAMLVMSKWRRHGDFSNVKLKEYALCLKLNATVLLPYIGFHLYPSVNHAKHSKNKIGTL